MKSFTKPMIQLIKSEIEASLSEIAKKNGITFSIGNIRFNDDNFRTTLTANIVSKDVSGLTSKEIQMKKNVAMFANMYGIPSDSYNKTFTHNGIQYTLVGLMPSRPKYPVVGKSKSGVRYKFNVSVLTSLK